MKIASIKILSIMVIISELVGVCLFPHVTFAASQNRFWQYQCVDTMKYSRDTARAWQGKDSQLQALVHAQLSAIKNMGANCVALGTPYDLEFVPFMKVWVNEARAQGLMVWFRGNMSGWEGWFGYPKFTSVLQHHFGVADLISKHPELFAKGDIFTPAPEPENGMLGNPFKSAAAGQQLRSFLQDSYSNCTNSFKAIGKDVTCGYFSVNGDVAKNIFTPDMVQKTGGVVVIDHYVKTAAQLISDIENLHNKLKAPVFLGEFGAPIPDIHGNLTAEQQADVIDSMLEQLAEHSNIVAGVNYWVLSGGSTSLLNDDGSPRPVVATVKKYYTPIVITGAVTDTLDHPLVGAAVTAQLPGNFHAITGQDGGFALTMPNPGGQVMVMAEAENYVTGQSFVTTGSKSSSLSFSLTPSHPTLWYNFLKFLKGL